MLLEENKKISEVSEFSILPYTQIRRLGNLQKFCFTSNFESSCNLRCKNDKKLTEKKFKDQDMLLEEKKCPRFLSFRFYPKPKIENLEIPESVLFYFKF